MYVQYLLKLEVRLLVMFHVLPEGWRKVLEARNLQRTQLHVWLKLILKSGFPGTDDGLEADCEVPLVPCRWLGKLFLKRGHLRPCLAKIWSFKSEVFEDFFIIPRGLGYLRLHATRIVIFCCTSLLLHLLALGPAGLAEVAVFVRIGAPIVRLVGGGGLTFIRLWWGN